MTRLGRYMRAAIKQTSSNDITSCSRVCPTLHVSLCVSVPGWIIEMKVSSTRPPSEYESKRLLRQPLFPETWNRSAPRTNIHIPRYFYVVYKTPLSLMIYCFFFFTKGWIVKWISTTESISYWFGEKKWRRRISGVQYLCNYSAVEKDISTIHQRP